MCEQNIEKVMGPAARIENEVRFQVKAAIEKAYDLKIIEPLMELYDKLPLEDPEAIQSVRVLLMLLGIHSL